MDTQHSQRDDSQSELYLIAHKVRGEPAFDIATRFKCPICEPIRQGLDEVERGTIHCDECDEGQHWWVVATSGHRAYPYWYLALDRILVEDDAMGGVFADLDVLVPDLPPDLPDHYATKSAPTGPSLFDRLGLKRKAAGPQVTRRI